MERQSERFVRLTEGVLVALVIGLFSFASAAQEFEIDAATDVVGEAVRVTTQYEDTLLDVARRYGLGYEEIVRANPGIDPWLPGEGTEVLLPTRFLLPDAPRRGIVINLPELRLYYFPPAKDGVDRVVTYPISIGRMDWATPLGRTRVVAKAKDPTWYPPESIREEHAAENRPLPRVVPPGPDNPLGRYAMRLALPGYLIHGTNRPAGVGMRVTHGCIRMYPENIEELFREVPIDTPVHIVNQPYKMGWLDDTFYLEAHLPLDEDRINETIDLTALTRVYVAATRDRRAEVDWDQAEAVVGEALGLPVQISRQQGAADIATKTAHVSSP